MKMQSPRPKFFFGFRLRSKCFFLSLLSSSCARQFFGLGELVFMVHSWSLNSFFLSLSDFVTVVCLLACFSKMCVCVMKDVINIGEVQRMFFSCFEGRVSRRGWGKMFLLMLVPGGE
ncbi:hypothetical protein GGS20DRAFT_458184 [Poronia punctata]|nr:hypothetical protein GGS20DRAFT_458184 [Poronia punctata]